ncbi:50S ribosomal protein L28 [Candidatus Sumerlaeota bacterium]|nr:50S ribosomal protein L28 [Candidatus Sumerlaeota bacterium]
MMAMCEICGKKKQMGYRVSHAHNRTKHPYNANIQKIRVIEKNGAVTKKYVCTRCLKSGLVKKAV